MGHEGLTWDWAGFWLNPPHGSFICYRAGSLRQQHVISRVTVFQLQFSPYLYMLSDAFRNTCSESVPQSYKRVLLDVVIVLSFLCRHCVISGCESVLSPSVCCMQEYNLTLFLDPPSVDKSSGHTGHICIHNPPEFASCAADCTLVELRDAFLGLIAF